MTGNTFGNAFRITTFGESHGPGLGVVIDGCPAGLPLTEADVQAELDKRKPGQSEVTTQRKEADMVEILSGVFEGLTTGTPIAMLVRNADARSAAYENIRNIARPGHADFGYMEKYGMRDYRGGGRSSGRETLSRVAGGAVAKKLLSLYGVEVHAHTVAIGNVRAKPATIEEIKANVWKNPVRCADLSAADAMLREVSAAREASDSVGGIVEIVATGVPAGVGTPAFDKLDACLAYALMGIGGVKAVEIGAGIASAGMRGSEMNDEFCTEDGKVRTKTNRCGGILGGISTGMPIVCRAAIKPTPSISRPQRTVNLETGAETIIEITGRHDPSIVPRAVPVAEAMVALVIVDQMISGGLINPVSAGAVDASRNR
ncbi:chorismate synthase [Methanocella arvoryzae]|uniref:Chorismate synthase n=1 Tax=Methanocella arvoryzae (strain DSM 22066 / NBRC 105507 / MRE50) TaxID=351160 RepID=AROC_METAR|nr:chorismate synthase [Methanocella arvoryzae]Q0W6Q8.1 RecName: Full=Chorismate synthase; Short=CS; AltName: Full=5-enolpyruvylshikimate-3-phosphate phospholyase [Methanocella arvoryzae MRE50]CAJ35935.1 chorismate synthase [Methanocella arvoryzae MRE50]